MTDKEPFVSIITPVYNGEKYIAECIESVLDQTYQNWEYVIVNNRSSDSTLQIAESYAEKDSRVRISTNSEFLPVMDNLNHAFSHMSDVSKYCKVIHADDWMFPECVSRMVETAESYETIGVVGSYRLSGRKVTMDGLPYPSHKVSGKSICRDFLLNGNFYFGAPSNLLISSDLIRSRDRIYDPGYLQSDVAACLNFLKDSDYGFVHQVLTYTRRHEDSYTLTNPGNYPGNMYGYLKMTMDYGPYYLSEDEFKRCLEKKYNAYYNIIAQDLLYARGSLHSHKQNLEGLGQKLKWYVLVKSISKELLKTILDKAGLKLKRS